MRRSLPLLLIFVLGFLLGAAPLSLAAVTLEDLDRIVTQADGLKDFLSSGKKELRERYFQALQQYYGPERFPRAGFDAILKQLQKANRKIPWLGAALWETVGLGKPFEITTALKTSGRNLAPEWGSFYNEYLDGLRTTAKDILSLPDEKQREDAAREIFEQVESSMQSFARSVEESGAPKKERARRMGEFMEGVKADPQLKSAGAYLTLRFLRNRQIVDQLEARDPDLILDIFQNAYQKPGILTANLSGFPALAASLSRDHLLSPKDLLANEKIFPVRYLTTNQGAKVPEGVGIPVSYQFVPIPRRLHGIWKGIPLGECVGGGIPEETSPERWGTIALAQTELHHVEREGRYLGFTQALKGRVGHGTPVANIEFGAPVLANKAIIRDPLTGQTVSTTLYDLWFEKALQNLHSGLAGYVVSESNAINNAGVKSTVKQSVQYLTGDDHGAASYFRLSDPRWADLASVIKRKGLAGRYADHLIIDAGVKNAGALTQLRKVKGEALDTEKGRAEFFDSLTVNKLRRYLNWVETQPAEQLAVYDRMAHLARVSLNPEIILTALETMKSAPTLTPAIKTALEMHLESRNASIANSAAHAFARLEPATTAAVEKLFSRLPETDLEIFLQKKTLDSLFETLEKMKPLPESIRTKLLVFLTAHPGNAANAATRARMLAILLAANPADAELEPHLRGTLASDSLDAPRIAALKSIRAFPPSPRLAPILKRLARTGSPKLSLTATATQVFLNQIDSRTFTRLEEAFTHADFWIRADALNAYASHLKNAQSLPPIALANVVRRLADSHPAVRAAAEELLKQTPPQDAPSQALLRAIVQNKGIPESARQAAARIAAAQGWSVEPIPGAPPISLADDCGKKLKLLTRILNLNPFRRSR